MAEYCLFCGRRRVAVARYRMICLVLANILCWIRQLGTAAPYGCNDHIDSIGNLTSPGCQSINVLNLFDRTSRRHRSHGSRKYNKPKIHDVLFNGLLPFVNLQLGLHHIRTKLYSLSLKRRNALYESTLTLHFTDVGSPGHRLQGIILDISSNRLFKAVRVGELTETRNRPFLNVKFANKGIGALNVSNILNHKPGGLSRECAPPYPQRDRKRRLNGAVCRNHRIKRLVPCRC